jgi:hypothetical protein
MPQGDDIGYSGVGVLLMSNEGYVIVSSSSSNGFSWRYCDEGDRLMKLTEACPFSSMTRDGGATLGVECVAV